MRTQKAGRTGRGQKTTRRGRGRSTPTEGQYAKAFNRWKDGEQISVLAAELNIRRGALRHHLEKLAGGHDEFKALRAAGSGGIRPSLGERAANARLDRGAKFVPVRRRAKWTHKTLRQDGEKVHLFVTGRPGFNYVPAAANQKADVLAEMGNGLPPARLVRFVPESRAD